jgi:hypothetical protein
VLLSCVAVVVLHCCSSTSQQLCAAEAAAALAAETCEYWSAASASAPCSDAAVEQRLFVCRLTYAAAAHAMRTMLYNSMCSDQAAADYITLHYMLRSALLSSAVLLWRAAAPPALSCHRCWSSRVTRTCPWPQ